MATNLSGENVVAFQCPNINSKGIVSLDENYLANIYVVVVINVLETIFASFANSLVIYGAYTNKQLSKVTRTLSILLAGEGLFGALVIQTLFVISKFVILANVHNPTESIYCIVVRIIAYASKLFVLISIVTMLGITGERLAAVAYPFHYRTVRTVFLKTLPYVLAVFCIHFVLGDIWSSYTQYATALTVVITILPYIFTIYAYSKIYFKLRSMARVRASNVTKGVDSKTKAQSISSFMVVATYLICYLPVIINRALKLDNKYLVVKLYLRPWINTLLFSSFSVNAPVYSWRIIRPFLLVLWKRTSRPRNEISSQEDQPGSNVPNINGN